MPLRFPWDGPLPSPQVRTIQEIRAVLMDPACDCPDPLYFMYRNLSRSGEDARWLARQNLRYDITVIPGRVLCGELVKTKGHHHPDAGGGIAYPEIYEVLRGEAHYLLQTRPADDVRVVKAREGERVLVPPGFGHVTINPGKGTLVMANIVSTLFESDYSVYERLRGAAYYELSDRRFMKNPRYPGAAPLRAMNAGDQKGLRALPDLPLYELIGTPGLGFLNRPGDYPELFA